MPAVPTTVAQKFTSYYELESYLCNKDAASFCQGGKSLVFMDVCANMAKMDIEVMTGSGIASICQADINGKICADQTTASMNCPGGKIVSSLCAMLPDKCDKAKTNFDSCADNWKACLNDPNWKFCNSFPEFCDQSGSTITIPTTATNYNFFKSGQELIDKICSTDSAKFCGGGNVPRLDGVCNAYNDLPDEVKHQSTFYQLCNEFDWTQKCYAHSANAMPTICSDMVLKNNLCEVVPDQCSDECVSNVYDCLAKMDWHGGFKKTFPTLARKEYKAMNFTSGQEMIDYVCNADSAKFCGGGAMIEFNAVCDNLSSIPNVENDTTIVSFEMGTTF
jgi:hypothetical protein